MGHCSASWQEKKKGHGKLRMALKGISGKMESLSLAAVFLGAVWVVIHQCQQSGVFGLQAAYVTCKHAFVYQQVSAACFNVVTNVVVCEPIPSTFLARGW